MSTKLITAVCAFAIAAGAAIITANTSLAFLLSMFGVAVLFSMGYESVNAFHDTAHASATSVASGVFAMKPRDITIFGRRYHLELQWTRYWIPVLLSCIFNFIGAYFGGTLVALFIPKIIAFGPVPLRLIMAAMAAAVVWNLYTWWRAIPVSSTHCLIGGLTGAGVMAAALGLFAGKPGMSAVSFHELGMAVVALIAAPFVAYILALLVGRLLVFIFGSASEPKWSNTKTVATLAIMGGLIAYFAVAHVFAYWLLAPFAVLWAFGVYNWKRINAALVLRLLQAGSSCMVSMAHGRNDGQKTMGVMIMLLAIWSGSPVSGAVPHWVIFLCAMCMGVGTMVGAERIIRTVGEKLSTKPLGFEDGFAAEAVGAGLIHGASALGSLVSTTQTLTGGVLGAAAGVHSSRALRWHTFKNIFLALGRALRHIAAFLGLVRYRSENTADGGACCSTPRRGQMLKNVWCCLKEALAHVSGFVGMPLNVKKSNIGGVLSATMYYDEESTMNWDTVSNMVKAWVYTFVATYSLAGLFLVLLGVFGIG